MGAGHSAQTHVAGVDGCRAGWVVVTAGAGAGRVTVRLVASFAEIVELIGAAALAAVAIDIPMGLTDDGPRECDRLARAMLGPRRSSVFPAPVRSVLDAGSWEEASERSRVVAGRGVSRQAWNLVPKIAEVDAMLTPHLQRIVLEAHPELGFALLAGRPMAHSKRTRTGRAERVEVLMPAFPDAEEAAARPPPGAAPDDVLDALVLAWTAGRWVRGDALVLGGATDSRGLVMRIVG